MEESMGKTSKPLPCPFCGTGAVIMRLTCTRMVGNKSQHPYLIGCSDPECILYLDAERQSASLMFAECTSRKAIIEKWNRRRQEDNAWQDQSEETTQEDL